MSLKTKIRGFTSWVNLRLKPYGQLMNNVLMDLLTGTNVKLLLQSLTGREMTKIDNFDGLSQQQKITRVQWMLDELKRSKVIADDVFVDTRLFAMRSADHIFQLMWHLACHDIWFVWERAEYLLLDNDETLTEVPFKWIPEPPPMIKKKMKTKQSLLSGFGASSIITEKIEEDDMEISEAYNPYPKSDFMKKFKGRPKNSKLPAPDECILELVNKQLQSTHEGKKLQVLTLDDLNDSRVLCALVNSFFLDLFTTEVLLNDRWTINTVLRTVERMFYVDSPFDSEDLVEGDSTSVCAYFCTFFMLAFKYRQSKAVVNWMTHLKQAIKEKTVELDEFPQVVSSHEDAQRRKELRTDIDNIKIAMDRIEKKYDMDFCYKWMLHIDELSKETHKMIRAKIKKRFDEVHVPRNISINEMCLSAGINLTLTNGTAFFLVDSKESVTENRKIIVKELSSGDYYDDWTIKRRGETVRQMLGVAERQTVDIYPEKHPKYQIFLASLSRNRQLHPGSVLLYQVFPGTLATWQKIFTKAVKENDFETVKRMTLFFRTLPSFINGKEPQTGNSALHWACRLGHYDMVEYLLENSADMDLKNSTKQTPLFSACEGQHRNIAHLLVEWGCDIHVKGPRSQTAFEIIRSDEFREYLVEAYTHYSSTVPRVMEGDTALLTSMIDDHASGARPLNNLRSRCINGSTLLHTSAYFGCDNLLIKLFGLGVDVNLLDYKGASLLHRARHPNTIRVLMEAGVSPGVEDLEGNTPLHVKCYGETGAPSEIEAVQLLHQHGAKLTVRNLRELMPIHCCAMQGRSDLIELLLSLDKEGAILTTLQSEVGKKPPSLAHLAVANDFLHCAEWLIESGFGFKEGEQDLLLHRIISEQIKLEDETEVLKFLLDHNANPNPRYAAQNTALHYCASLGAASTNLLELLMEYGAHIDAVNDDGASPLFFACQANNQFAASVLIDRGANVRLKNINGLTAFDFIVDYEEWIECGYFSEEIRARLKAYNLKHARDLIRAITKKVKSPPNYLLPTVPTAVSSAHTELVQSELSHTLVLPPLSRHKSLTY